jgi:hypothetical protein
MFLLTPHTQTAILFGCGAVMLSFSAHHMARNPELDTPLNPLGINRSPYGEVVAMAAQGPIDTYFHNGSGHDHDHDHTHDHDHSGQHDHDHDHEHNTAQSSKKGSAALPDQLRGFIDRLAAASSARNNPRPVTSAHQFYMRRKTEDKLRFAYNLDPAHYGNYNSYHLFLTESQFGTRRQLTPTAIKLAKETIDYCLAQKDDPRPVLTAAAAASNILELMINNVRGTTPHFSTDHLKEALAVLDHCLARHHELSAQWLATGNWSRLSTFRIKETQERLHFITKVRDAEEKAIHLLEMESKPFQAIQASTLTAPAEPQTKP